jgi:uncharacterized repeat protein (TIGR03803 family)
MEQVVNKNGKRNWRKRAYAGLLLSAATAGALSAQTFTPLTSFNSTDGANPYYAGLVQGTDGNLYGTTVDGGANTTSYCIYGCGTVFKIARNGNLTTLYNFCSQSGCTDGQSPQTGVIQATNGDFYGTTFYNGANCAPYGCDTVFKVTPNGKLTTLYSFCSQSGCTDGVGPHAGLIQATNGDFYGVTNLGETYSSGTIFKITPSGRLTTLYSFCSQTSEEICTDGAYPYGGLVQAANGDIYGTTSAGGFPPVENGSGGGTVFKITLGGKLTTLYSFCGQSGCGYGPLGTLVQASNGDFYGTTWGGGAAGWGTIFRITQRGKVSTFYSFCSQAGCADGGYPQPGLIQATDGNLYGTNWYGGANGGVDGYGTVFRITPAGSLTTLYNFCSQPACVDGGGPDAALYQSTDGEFYGTTSAGGASGDGTVFSLSVGLGPFVETLPTSGTPGATIKILGTNLTGTTGVTFSGTAAAFEVVSPSEILAVVPVGATSGKVQVTTPDGTLSSNVRFRVHP